VRVLDHGKISAQGPKVCEILHLPQLKQRNTRFLKKKKKKKTRRRDTRVGGIWELLNRDIDEFILLWEFQIKSLQTPESGLGVSRSGGVEG